MAEDTQELMPSAPSAPAAPAAPADLQPDNNSSAVSVVLEDDEDEKHTNGEADNDSTFDLNDSPVVSRRVSLDMNDDLLNRDVSSSGTPRMHSSSRHAAHRRGGSISTLSSFRHSFDDSSALSLGSNKVSTASVSPLGQNSIFELVQGAERQRRHLGMISVNNGSTTINLRGPTLKEIPPIQLSRITKAKNALFKPYIHGIDDSYDKFQANRKLTQSTLQAFIEKCEEEERKQNVYDDKSIATGASSRDVEEEAESLSVIPQIYFSNDFRLDDPRVFDKVTESSSILSDGNTDFNNDGVVKPLSNNNILQEKLSSYLDIVEIHLIHEISKSSSSFFTALDDLKNITVKSRNSTTMLKDLDAKFNVLEKNQTEKAIEILKMTQKRNNTEKLEQVLLQISTIMQHADLAEASYYNANYNKSLDQIDQVEALIRGDTSSPDVQKLVAKWPYSLKDLRQVNALAGLKQQLNNLRMDTGRSYTKLFVDFLIDDLRNHYEKVPKTDTIHRMTTNVSKDAKREQGTLNLSYQMLDEKFKSQLNDFMHGLTRCKELSTAFKAYEEAFMADLKNIVKLNLPTDILDSDSVPASSRRTSSVRSDGRSGSGNLSNNVRSLTPKEFEDTLITIYCQLSEALRRLMTHQKILLDVALNAISVANSRLLQDEPDLIMQLDITKSVNACIEVSQNRISKVIGVRREQTASVSLDFFLRFYSANGLFLYECETISGVTVTTSLQDVIEIQTKLFASQFHNISLTMIKEKVEKEVWRDCLLPKSVQKLVDEIVSSAEEDPASWLEVLKLEKPSASTNNGNHSADDDRKTLTIDDKSLIVPVVAVGLLKVLRDYLILKMVFPANIELFEQNVIEILRVFNLHVNHAVLGAAATRTAGLKHISLKHLAIASQLLDFVICLIPYIKACFHRSKKPENRNDNFDELKSQFQDHQNQIFVKLVEIMTERVKRHCDDIKTIDWSQPLRQVPCHPYMEVLVKETLTVSRVLQRYLPESQFTVVLSKIFEEYKRSLVDQYLQVKFKDSVEKAVMMKDIDYFREKLADIIGYGNSGQVIWENVNAMETDEDIRMEQIMRQNIINEKRRSAEIERSQPSTPRLSADLKQEEPVTPTPVLPKAEAARSEKKELPPLPAPEIVVEPSEETPVSSSGMLAPDETISDVEMTHANDDDETAVDSTADILAQVQAVPEPVEVLEFAAETMEPLESLQPEAGGPEEATKEEPTRPETPVSSVQPEIDEPETTEPDVTKPEVADTVATSSDVSPEVEVSKPEAIESDAVDEEVIAAEPETAPESNPDESTKPTEGIKEETSEAEASDKAPEN